MATQLTIVNNVLRRLREDTVTSVADNAYAQLIAMWVNDGMREVSNAYDWQSLIHTCGFTIVAGDSDYDLSATVANGGDVSTSRATTAESFLCFDERNNAQAFLFDSITDDDYNIQMRYIWDMERHAKRNRNYAPNTTSLDRYEDPYEFGLTLTRDGSGYNFKFWQIPSESRYANLMFWTPQDDLAIDGTDDSTNVIVHNPSVEAYVHMIAANERGEEIGEPGNLLERRYINTLAAAIETASSSDTRANRYESRRD